jgi:arylsulfatase A-like enzyme
MGRGSAGLAFRAVVAAVALLAACSRREPPPSIVLVVMDTTRADAVSAYGEVAGTTPVLDALAAGGVLYRHAYASSPWTLPSHATLFTGLRPDRHGVDWQAPVAGAALVLLAERLRDAGYETMGYSENPWIGGSFGMTQGFDRFHEAPADAATFETTLSEWLRARDAAKPLFLFANLMDAHWPYEVRATNPHLPPGISTAEAGAVSQWPPDYMCSGSSRRRELEILRGLYLGDVAAADAKLGRLQELVRTAGLERAITVVTSDHGEHFGEHGLCNHQFSLRNSLLHVPLVVHGVRGGEESVVDEAVELADVAPSIAKWSGLPPDAAWTGRPLPLRPAAATRRDLLALYVDPARAGAGGEPTLARLGRRQAEALRSHCTAEDRVWGDMRALTRHPLKLLWFEGYPAELYDLRADPGEERDLAGDLPEAVAEMQAALEAARR